MGQKIECGEVRLMKSGKPMAVSRRGLLKVPLAKN